MLRGVNRTDDDDENHKTGDELLAKLREGASERRAQQGQHAYNTRWRLFMAAVMFVSQVFMELGRRSLQCQQRNVPQYIVCVDRWLVQSLRVSVYCGRKMGAAFATGVGAGVRVALYRADDWTDAFSYWSRCQSEVREVIDSKEV